MALASVFVPGPEVLLLDEPTAALDPRSQNEVVRFLADCRGTGRTVVTATHNLDIVAEIADYCFVLQGGHLVAEGAPMDVLGDLSLLRSSQLQHAHWHVHADGLAHAHARRHRSAGIAGQ